MRFFADFGLIWSPSDYGCSPEGVCIVKSWLCIFIPFLSVFLVLCINIAYFVELCIFMQNAIAVDFWLFFAQFFVAGLDSPLSFERALIPYKT